MTSAVSPAWSSRPASDTPAQELFEELGGHCPGRGCRPGRFLRRGPQSPLYPRPPFGVGANMAFRRAALARIGGFDTALGAGTPTCAGEDTLALSLLLLGGYRIAYEPAALMRHHHRQDLAASPSDARLRSRAHGLLRALLRHRPAALAGLLRLAPAAYSYLRRNARLSTAATGPPPLPPGFRRQRWWMLAGPAAYLRSMRPAGPGGPAGAQVLIRPPQAGRPAVRKARHAARETAARAQGRVSAVALSAATGVAVAAAADTAGRLGHAGAPWADALYWLGQAMVLVPISVRLLSQRVVTAAETVALVVILTVAEYLIRICYSPAAFSYPDELEHWRSTVDVLQTGQLFTANDLLPISPHFPGLEEATSALASVTGLSVFHAA